MSEQGGNNQANRNGRFNGSAPGANGSNANSGSYNNYSQTNQQGYGYQGQANPGQGPGFNGYNHNGAYNNNAGFNQYAGGYGSGNGNGYYGNTPNGAPFPWDRFEIRLKRHRNPICSFLLAVGSVITFARNLVFNLIFLAIIALVFLGHYLISDLKENGLSMSQAVIEQMESSALAAQVLYFDLSGSLTEAPYSPNQFDSMQRELEYALNGTYSHELVAIENALNLVADDKEIKKVLINVDGMAPMTLSVAERIGKAMEHARALKSASPEGKSEREVIVMGTNFSQAAYVLAAHADKVVLDPLGEISLRGIALSSLYFKDALERFNLTPYIFRAGRFKSAVEPFLLNGMSSEVRRSYQDIANKSWNIYLDAIQSRSAIKNRTKILPDAATYVKWVEEYNGDRAALQKSQGLVDEVMALDDYLQKLSTEVNSDADRPSRPAIITYQDYLLRHHYLSTGQANVGSLSSIDVPRRTHNEDKKGPAPQQVMASVGLSTTANTVPLNSSLKVASPVATISSDPLLAQLNDAQQQIERRIAAQNRSSTKVNSGEVAVIYGIGEIRDGGERITDFTYDNIAPLIEEAADNPSIKAVVLYLNSPGGSVTASEKIRRALAQFQRQTVKPLVVSMSGTAASGAYWIGAQAERIFATKSTLTGSIGVFGITLGAHKLLNEYGAHQDGVVTNELAVTAIGQEMPQSQQDLLNLSVDNVYHKFINLVARNRNLEADDYEQYAEGQVFLAQDAQAVGLVDEIGDLDDAIAYAAAQAKLNPDNIRVKHLVPSSSSNFGNFGFIFGLAHAYLPDNVTYALLKFHETMSLAKDPEKVSLQALTPMQSPKL